MNELTVIKQESVFEVFTTENGLDPYMAQVRENIDSFVPDLTTDKGRKEIASMAAKVAKSKTYMDGVGKDLTTELKKQPKAVDAERKRMRDTLDAWKDEVRKPLTDWENKEKSRIQTHEDGLKAIRTLAHGYVDELNSSLKNVDQLKESLSKLSAIDMGEQWDEFEAKALLEKTSGEKKLSELIEAAEKEAAQQAEIERLQREEQKRKQEEHERQIAAAAAEQAKKEAEAKAESERLEAERKANEAAQAAENQRLAIERQAREAAAAAEQAVKDAENRAAQAEKEALAKIEAEKKQQEEDAAKREANKKHKAKINNEALSALVVAGLSENDAKAAVSAIAKGSVPNVSIAY